MIIRAQTCKHACIFVQATSWKRKLEVHTLHDCTVKITTTARHTKKMKEKKKATKCRQELLSLN